MSLAEKRATGYRYGLKAAVDEAISRGDRRLQAHGSPQTGRDFHTTPALKYLCCWTTFITDARACVPKIGRRYVQIKEHYDGGEVIGDKS